MAADVTTVSTTLPAQMVELAGILYGKETLGLNLADPDITARKLAISPNPSNGTLTITFTVPVTTQVDTDGKIEFSVPDYLPNVA